MKATNLRTILVDVLKNYNAHHGDNTGSFGENNYKINYQIGQSTLLENQRTYSMEIDVWCNDSVQVDKLSDEIEALLNYKTYESATFYLDNRYPADEKEIYRRTLTYEVRTFKED